MTDVRALIKYSPNIIEVSNKLMDRVDIWRKVTDGSSRFNLKLLGVWTGSFAADDPIQLRLNDIVVFEGYIDQGMPIAEANVYNQFYQLAGRDYSRELFNRLVNKTGSWMYAYQSSDLIVDDMLTKAGADITFTPSAYHKYGSSSAIASGSYTDNGSEYLIEAFRKIFEECNVDYYVDENKKLVLMQVGTSGSGIVLTCITGSTSNNILSLEKVAFDNYDLHNYIVAKVDNVNDGWTDGNSNNFSGSTGNTLSDDFSTSSAGMGSIKCARGSSANSQIILTFPRFGYDYLPFNVFNENKMRVEYRFDGHDDQVVEIIFLDDAGHTIEWRPAPNAGGDTYNVFIQTSIPIGSRVTIDDYSNAMFGLYHSDVFNRWQYTSTSPAGTFNWKVVKITIQIVTKTSYEITNLWTDNWSIPIPMLSVVQNSDSQTLYGVRKYSVSPKYVRTQSELDQFAASQLQKMKDPLYSLHVTALGSAGLIGSTCMWIPGLTLMVNSPGDAITNVEYRINECHYIISEAGISGHDFIVELDLVPKNSLISGRRLSGVTTPEISSLRELSEKIRALEKQEDIVSDYLPPLPADAAEKIQVGDFGSLAQTAVKFTRHWEAEDALADERWWVTSDNSGSEGSSRMAFRNTLFEPPDNGVGTGEAIWFNSGSVLGCVGEFYAITRLKVSHLDASKMVSLRIVDRDTAEELANLDINGNQFPTANKYHHFAMRVEIPAVKQNVEFDVRFWAQTNLRSVSCDYLALLPADIPLGYADVTVGTTDPGTTGDNVDPGSTGDSTNPGSTGDTTDPGSTGDSTNPGSTGDSTNPGSTGDTTDPGTTATASPSRVVNTGSSCDGASYTVTANSWRHVGTFTGSNAADIEEMIINYYLIADVANIVKVRVADLTENPDIYYPSPAGTDCIMMTPDGSGNFYSGNMTLTIPTNAKNHLMYFEVYTTEAGEFLLNTIYWGHAPHTHAIANDSHVHSVSGDEHVHAISGDTHTHTVSGDAHVHTVSGDTHTHTVSGDSHTTPIYGDSHTHSESDSGHEH